MDAPAASGGLAQLARAPALQAGGRRFDSDILHQPNERSSFQIISPVEDRMRSDADKQMKFFTNDVIRTRVANRWVQVPHIDQLQQWGRLETDKVL